VALLHPMQTPSRWWCVAIRTLQSTAVPNVEGQVLRMFGAYPFWHRYASRSFTTATVPALVPLLPPGIRSGAMDRRYR